MTSSSYLLKLRRHRKFGDIVTSVFTPVLAKHSKSFSLVDCISVGADRMQRNLEPMRKQVEAWQIRTALTILCRPGAEYKAGTPGRILGHPDLQVESFEWHLAAWAVGCVVFERTIGDPVAGHG